MLAFVDLETTGLDWNKHVPIQIGYVIVDDDGNVKERGSYFIKPTKELNVQIDALMVNNINLIDAYKKGKSWMDIYKIFGKYRTKFILAGWNVFFDYMFLRRKMLGFTEVFESRGVLDVKSLYINKFKHADSLKVAAKNLNIGENIKFHDAGDDAFVTYKIWRVLNGI